MSQKAKRHFYLFIVKKILLILPPYKVGREVNPEFSKVHQTTGQTSNSCKAL